MTVPVCERHRDVELHVGLNGFVCPQGCADHEAGRRFRVTELTPNTFRWHCYRDAKAEFPGSDDASAAARLARYTELVTL